MNVAAEIAEAHRLVLGGDAPGARAALDRAMAREPRDARLMHARAQVEFHAGDLAGAEQWLARATAASPGDATLRTDHAKVLWGLGRLEDAAAEFGAGVRSAPADLDARLSLAQVHLERADFAASWAGLEDAVRAVPGDPEVYRRWSELAVRAGEVDEALRIARLGVAAWPRDVGLLVQLASTMNFADGVDAGEHLGVIKRLAAASGRGGPERVFANVRDPEKRLTVAFLSPDFRFHACAFFLAGLMSRMDQSRVRVLAYSTGRPDGVTGAFSQLCELREMSEWTHARIAAAAEQDGVDIAVDCAGWSAGSRLEAMIPRLAPVQVTYLGWPHTTGSPSLDWRVVDAVTDPPGAEAWATEKLLRLERCFVCFAMPDHTPEPALSPSLGAYARGGAMGPVTFASFNRLEKVQGAALRVWARILQRVPGSRLLIKAAPFSGVRASFERRFAAAGGDASRVDWTGFEMDPSAHLRAFHRVDIALDPFPYNGTTTTCEALLMGVPVVALRGESHRARVGASLLTSTGLGELVAASEDQYVEIAARLASDPAGLLSRHQSTRGAMLNSPVCDASGYARDFEHALRGAWRAWCGGAM